jgi:outer membrane protein
LDIKIKDIYLRTNLKIKTDMRNFFKVIVLCSAIFAGNLNAQTLKFGHIDFQLLLSAMPERDAAKAALDKVQADLVSKLDAMQKEYGEKGKEYVALAQAKDANEALVKAKQDEVQSIQERIQTFQQTAQESLQKEETKLFQPVIVKARKAISDVAKEQGLLYVFEVNGVLYFSEQSMDLITLVKAKLAIK